ncbi:MAG: iron-sulfur cluster repair di-iron protein [Acidobacteriaceae bacterium]
MAISVDLPVREIVVEHPETIPVLEQLGIDYCCGGQHTLAEACVNRGLSPATVLEELDRRPQDTDAADNPWSEAKLKDLIDYIVEKHHAFARNQLELIRDLAAKVERRHGSNHPEIFEVSEAFAAISTELSHHFYCEESILFPHIANLETGQPADVPSIPASVQQPVSRMMMDHEHAGNEFRLLREITHDFQPPVDACTTYKALYRAMEDLERDLHRHIHLENNILFPRALEEATKTA